MTTVLGLDIGGANLKAAHTDGPACSRAFDLWKHPDRLAAELRSLCAAMPAHDHVAVTMTGELCDCFETKRAGVLAILESVCEAIAARTSIWTTNDEFVDVEAARRDPLPVAAANWLALARWAAQLCAPEDGLLLDVGSTTSDLVYLHEGLPAPRGLTDTARLEASELVYTGVRRTPVCAVLGREVAAEFFATMHDVHVLRGSLPEQADNLDTADGRPMTRPHAHARLARMLCGDAESCSLAEAQALARRAAKAQEGHLHRALCNVLHGRRPPTVVIVCGSGEFLAKRVAALGLPAARKVALSRLLSPAQSDAACAHAVGQLALQRLP